MPRTRKSIDEEESVYRPDEVLYQSGSGHNKTPKLKARKVIHIRADRRKVAWQIENFSQFVDICLEQAPDIMAFALLKRQDPKKYYGTNKLEDVLDDYNRAFGMDRKNNLTKINLKKQGKWQDPSHRKLKILS